MIISTAAVITLLLGTFSFRDRPEAEISLDAVVSGLSFTTSTPQRFTEVVSANSVGFYGSLTVAEPGTISVDSDLHGVLFRRLDAPAAAGTIDLAPLETTADRRISLSVTEAPSSIRVSMTLSSPIQVWTSGELFVGSSEVSGKRRRYGATTLTTLRTKGDIDINIATDDQNSLRLALPISVKALWFERFDDASVVPSAANPVPTPRRLSTLLSGDLYQQSLRGERHSLTPRQILNLTLGEGQLTDVRFAADGLHVHFDGTVTGMTVGRETASRSLMPSYLEWVLARHRLQVFWTALVSSVGVLIALTKWWVKP